MSNKWMHKNIEITMDASATFRASVPGTPNTLRAPSLDAIRKQIDKALETVSDFKPFDCIEADSGRIVFNNVIAVGKSESRYGSEYEFTVKENGRWERTARHACVIPDSPANREALLAYEKLRDDAEKTKARLEKQVSAARTALPWLTADDIATRKVKK